MSISSNNSTSHQSNKDLLTTDNNFIITRIHFEEYLGYDRSSPYTFEQWSNLRDDCKTAALFCVFFNEITLAWYKVVTSYSRTDDGVDEVLRYLHKNVPIILAHPQRYTPQYIYRVAYNCLDCLCVDHNRYRKWYDHEQSNIRADGSNIYDGAESPTSDFNISKDFAKAQMWKDIEAKGGLDAVAVVNSLIRDVAQGEDGNWDNFNSRQASIRYKKLEREHKVAEVLDSLKEILEKYIDILGDEELILSYHQSKGTNR